MHIYSVLFCGRTLGGRCDFCFEPRKVFFCVCFTLHYTKTRSTRSRFLVIAEDFYVLIIYFFTLAESMRI
ncbi:hypothetical protein M430DRAFT_200810 [Amorphotheca resinae ATCC 22711]|uniref:Uncharacterized protein n=1 Tax=Amorphotheca resinae ATCC 22711 TaxID=857342 RepID=A0A2T3BAH1_AMORE|nr:hypothetical protein M430DRAFT_200810 [Amorphotheca resinae ATCC 22711]PSS25327.1 hypothetical protein M430DRAFT_200810 [Amorphotheca resinae ATCC 22711]